MGRGPGTGLDLAVAVTLEVSFVGYVSNFVVAFPDTVYSQLPGDMETSIKPPRVPLVDELRLQLGPALTV